MTVYQGTIPQALRGVVEGNELFKKQNENYVVVFKTAHQSLETRQLVEAMKR